MQYADEDHDHGPTEAERLAMAEALWRQETLRLVTVGIDIGSSTSHLLFARVLFQRQGLRATARFVPVERVVHWRSPIMLTPFLPDGTIDADALSRFVRHCYADAGLAPTDVGEGDVPAHECAASSSRIACALPGTPLGFFLLTLR